MNVDKTEVRAAKAIYQQWNEEKFIDEVLSAGSRSQEEKWQEYTDLLEFCRASRQEQTIWEERITQEEWESYYRSVMKFEEKRKTQGLSYINTGRWIFHISKSGFLNSQMPWKTKEFSTISEPFTGTYQTCGDRKDRTDKELSSTNRNLL